MFVLLAKIIAAIVWTSFVVYLVYQVLADDGYRRRR